MKLSDQVEETGETGPKANLSLQNFDWSQFILTHRYEALFFLLGLILVGFGIFFAQKQTSTNSNKIEILESTTESQGALEIIVEVVGEVVSPGVYKLPIDARVEDALIAAGGVSVDADRSWMEKSLNRASRLTDGEKLYIPNVGETSNALSNTNFDNNQSGSTAFSDRGSGLINVNTASQKELESLSGIGPVYGQNIIEHRPYSSVEELLSKGALKSHVYEKIKDQVTVY